MAAQSYRRAAQFCAIRGYLAPQPNTASATSTPSSHSPRPRLVARDSLTIVHTILVT